MLNSTSFAPTTWLVPISLRLSSFVQTRTYEHTHILWNILSYYGKCSIYRIVPGGVKPDHRQKRKRKRERESTRDHCTPLTTLKRYLNSSFSPSKNHFCSGDCPWLCSNNHLKYLHCKEGIQKVLKLKRMSSLVL